LAWWKYPVHVLAYGFGWKPYPIGLVEEGFGVGMSIMADDIVAGIYAWCILQLVRWSLKR